jgi:hypothetical protein
MKNLSTQITWSGTPPTTTPLNEKGWIEALWTVPAGEPLLGYDGESFNPWPGLSKDCRVTNLPTRQ